jgi:hypothetical protein
VGKWTEHTDRDQRQCNEHQRPVRRHEGGAPREHHPRLARQAKQLLHLRQIHSPNC